jgi:ABC-type branched-subunit amino acid transport system ATPase component
MTMEGKVQPLLETRDLTCKFSGLTALNKVNFLVYPHEVRCLIGPNGAGKTTFFNLITAVLPPNDGNIFFNGRSITKLDMHKISRLGISRTFQVPNLFGQLSALQNVCIAAQRHWETFNPLIRINAQPKVTDVAMQALERVGLTYQKDRIADNLAHAQKKRLDLAIALVSEPLLLLLDEPTAGMTAAETNEIVQLIKILSADMTMLVVEHDIEFVHKVAHRVSVLHRGEILIEGALEEIEANRMVREIYLGSRPEE